MKNRHLLGALIAIAPVVAIAQVGTVPPVGNASESAGAVGASREPMMDNAAGDVAAEANTNSVDDGTTTTNTTALPDPTAPKPKAMAKPRG